MLKHQKAFYSKPKNTDGLKKVLQLKWNQLPQDSINKTTLNVLWDKLFKDTEHWTLQVTVHFFRRSFEIRNRIL